jgi:HEAT repeat protein
VVEGLQDSDVGVRYAALIAAQLLGPDMKESVGAVEARLRDPDVSLRAEATQTLLAIDPQRYQHLKAGQKVE